jgi:hypothetical protein
MGAIPIEEEMLQELLLRKATLVQAITTAMASGTWEPVMPAFDDLLGTITRIEGALAAAAKARGIPSEQRA